jgi:hypothetical protein
MEIVARLRSNGIDPVPRLEVDGKAIELARPLKWYEYLWIGLPVLLIFAGGALGALIGLTATYCNAHVLRSERGVASRYALTALVSISATAAFIALAAILQILIRR